MDILLFSAVNTINRVIGLQLRWNIFYSRWKFLESRFSLTLLILFQTNVHRCIIPHKIIFFLHIYALILLSKMQWAFNTLNVILKTKSKETWWQSILWLNTHHICGIIIFCNTIRTLRTTRKKLGDHLTL